jgi:hypothetical protein
MYSPNLNDMEMVRRENERLRRENERLRKSLKYLEANRVPPLVQSYLRSLRQENEALRDRVALRDRWSRLLAFLVVYFSGGGR